MPESSHYPSIHKKMKSSLILLLVSCSLTWSSPVIPEEWSRDQKVASYIDEEKADNRTTITVPNGGPYGEWQFLETCPGNSTAVGFQLKVERSAAVDATGLNAIRLYCLDLTVNPPVATGTITSFEQIWGNWGDRVNCLGTAVLTAFQLKVEAFQGGNTDDSMANDVRFRCSNGEVLSVSNGGAKGEWGPFSDSCPDGICGIEVKTEMDQGAIGDDTALNDARFFCC